MFKDYGVDVMQNNHALLSVKEAAIELWGKYTDSTRHRTIALIKTKQIDSVHFGKRWVVPAKEIKKFSHENNDEA